MLQDAEMIPTLKSRIVIKYKNKGEIAIWLDINRCKVFGEQRLLASCIKFEAKGNAEHDKIPQFFVDEMYVFWCCYFQPQRDM